MRSWPIVGPPRFKMARWSDNELVLFDDQRAESWLVYPPRSRYEFVQRQTRDTTLVVHHPCAAASTTDAVCTPSIGGRRGRSAPCRSSSDWRSA